MKSCSLFALLLILALRLVGGEAVTSGTITLTNATRFLGITYDRVQLSSANNIEVTAGVTNITTRKEGDFLAVDAEFGSSDTSYRRLIFKVVPSAWPGPVLATNVVILTSGGDNHVGCSTCAMLKPPFSGGAVVLPAIHHPFHPDGLPYVAATEKWEITQKVRRETATFTWRGQSVSLTNDVLLEGVTNRWKFNAAWTKE